jgi:predicted nucleic acid-binding protein
MLDTNVFNRLVDGLIDPSFFLGKSLITTHVQRDELEGTRNDDRRKNLIVAYESVDAQIVPTESMVWDVSRWDNSKWSSQESKFEEMRDRLQQLDKKSGKSSSSSNLARDILILETAISNNYTLVTGDADLAQVCKDFDCDVIILK